MIEKSRLQELIDEGGRIWCIDEDEIIPIFLSCVQPEIPNEEILKTFFETKEQAEWYIRYHATRTEELDLPTWEEIEKIKEKDVYIIAKPKEMRFYIDYKFLIPQIKLCTLEDVFNWNLDEEGYLSACDLCVKLFKGGENNE